MNEEQLLNLVIMERMSWYYKKFRSKYPEEGIDKARGSDALLEYERLAYKLKPEDIQKMNDCLDEVMGMISADNERFYRAGIEDGIRLDRFIKQIKEKQD